jgi:hypothetical protein
MCTEGVEHVEDDMLAFRVAGDPGGEDGICVANVSELTVVLDCGECHRHESDLQGEAPWSRKAGSMSPS